jgi:DNA-binding CsgD family transcriptional regulator
VTERAHQLSTHLPQPTMWGLSPRELEVLEMTSLGLTNAQMAARLNVTMHAVKFHLAAIYRKLGVVNRTEAAVAYLRSSIPNDARQ